MLPRPAGTITFLFTDIEGSSQLWEQQMEAMRLALAKHDTILREAFESQHGFVFKTVGDAFCVAFDTAHDACAAALAAQRMLYGETWDVVGAIKVRMALHTGPAEQRDGDYFGPALNRVSRLLAAAHGGQTLLSLPTAELVRDHLAGGTRLRDLGERRLRDLTRPEHVFQLVTNDLPSEFPPLRSLESVPNNLPTQLTSFVGREREMAEVKRLLDSTHLLTLTGTGGTGKTRLSLQVAADSLEKFQDGVWLVEFATIDDSGLVPETVAAALNVRQETDRPLVATLTNYLRAKNLLLIFDNCEHVVAACARLAEALLRACPQLRILASSREPLGIAGETAWPLPPMSLPEHWRELSGGANAAERLLEYEAVRLFAERAAQARATFQLTDENATTVAQICWRLDGIPLAIELAAARIKVLTLAQIAERLDDRFHLLTGGSRTALPRQQTLRALVDWSYDLLTEPERMLLRRLSVFARGRTLEAVEAVCAGDGLDAYEIIDLLTQLVDKSLVTVEKKTELGGRYFMIESIWDYSHEKLAEAGETDVVQGRHLDYFLKFAEELEPVILGHGQRQGLARIEEESMNIRFAVEASLRLPGQVQKGLRLASAVQRSIEVRGLFKETRDDIAQLIAHPDGAVRNAVRAKALAAAARLAWVSDDVAVGLKLETEALELFRELGDPRGIARSLVNLAFYALDERDLRRAHALLAESRANAPAPDDARVCADILRMEAILASVEGDYPKAFAALHETFARYEEIGDEWMANIVRWGLGASALMLSRFDEARAHFRANLQNMWDIGNRWGVPYPLEAFAALAIAEKKFERAARLLGAAEALRTKAGLAPDPVDHPGVREILASAAQFFDKKEVSDARREGRGMAVDEAVKLALSE